MAKAVAHKQEKPVVAEVRTTRGSRAAQALRAAGKIPGVIYGLGKDPVAITVPMAEVVSILHSGAHIMDVQIEGKADKYLIQDTEYDYLQSNLEHIDLRRIDINQRVKVKVALEFRGTPKGAKEGGILETQTNEVEIEVSPLAIPDAIRVNVENLDLHQILHAKEIQLPAGAKLLEYSEKIICQVRTVKEEVAAVAVEAGPAEPEVIGKKKEEEGEEGAAAAGDKAKAAPAAKK